MELELINDILTSTVSKLFMNPSKHLNYFRSSEDNYRSDIPKSSNRREESFHSSQQIKSKEYSSQSTWKNTGIIKLDEAMRRLNLDEQRIKSKNLINFGMDYLHSEKAKVKAELKRYDNDFLDSFNRLPNRAEKEVMRPLYMYYKNLKNSIDFKHNMDSKSGGSGTHSRQNTSGSLKSAGSSSSKKQDVSNLNISNVANMGTNHEVASNISEININNINLTTNKTSKDDKKYNSPSHVNLNNSANYNNVQSKEAKEFSKEKRSSSASSASSLISNTDSKGTDIISFDDKPNSSYKKIYNIAKDKKLSKNELIGFEKELDGIRKEQHDLKQKLHAYQKEFYEVHNRRVKYYKDIIGIEYEYQKYKDNKNKIKELEEILAPYKKTK